MTTSAARLDRLRQRTHAHMTALPDNPTTDLQLGHLAAATQRFVPLLALARYPYRFGPKPHAQAVSSAFFDQGKFWNREWHL
jgi:hypothetical protein